MRKGRRGEGGLHATFSSRNETLAACVCVFFPPFLPAHVRRTCSSRVCVCQFAQPTRRTLAAAAVRPFARRLAAPHGGSRTTVSLLRPTDAKPAAGRGFCGLFANSCLSVRSSSSNVLNRARGPDALFFSSSFFKLPSFLPGSWFLVLGRAPVFEHIPAAVDPLHRGDTCCCCCCCCQALTSLRRPHKVHQKLTGGRTATG